MQDQRGLSPIHIFGLCAGVLTSVIVTPDLYNSLEPTAEAFIASRYSYDTISLGLFVFAILLGIMMTGLGWALTLILTRTAPLLIYGIWHALSLILTGVGRVIANLVRKGVGRGYP